MEKLSISKNKISEFKEKSTTKTNWISGGYFIFNKSFLNLIPKGDNSILETLPFTKLVKKNFMRLNIMDFGNVWIR